MTLVNLIIYAIFCLLISKTGVMWKVTIRRKQLRGLQKLPRPVGDLLFRLVRDLEQNGPVQPGWHNYSPLGSDRHHCHLNYRYVACWTADRETITIEVYYVGSRENAPY